jgi:hypothetical protein
MLREIEGVTGEPGMPRRWFHDDYFDLFVWEAEKGEVAQFQLCYGIASSDSALVWNRNGGLYHDGADPGKSGADAAEPIAARFETAAGSLPEKIRRTVSERIREYLEGKLKAPTRRKSFRRAGWQKQPATGRS